MCLLGKESGGKKENVARYPTVASFEIVYILWVKGLLFSLPFFFSLTFSPHCILLFYRVVLSFFQISRYLVLHFVLSLLLFTVLYSFFQFIITLRSFEIIISSIYVIGLSQLFSTFIFMYLSIYPRI